MKRLIVLWIAIAAMGSNLGAFPPPGRINYQGVLRDALGNPLNASVSMVFRLYDAPTGGTLFWEESYTALTPPQMTVANGLFTVALGDPAHRTGGAAGSLEELFNTASDAYLSVQVSTDGEMVPRVHVISSAYALNSLNSQMLNGLSDGQFLRKDVADTAAGVITFSAPTTDIRGSLVNGSLAATGVKVGDNLYVQGGTVGVGVAPDNNFSLYGSGSNYGIWAQGTAAGGYLKDSDQSGYGIIGDGDTGLSGHGLGKGGFFENLSAGGTAITEMAVKYTGPPDVFYGIRSIGSTAGGSFENFDSPGTLSAELAVIHPTSPTWNEYLGIRALGQTAGGYFEAPSHNFVYAATQSGSGIEAQGNNVGGSFANYYYSGGASLAYFDYGVTGSGSNTGGRFASTSTSAYGYIGYGTYKIWGNGSVNFVQNHPFEKDKVIVYAAPEGDEVATYTRGTAKLVNGEARVHLGETFKWVTNPDIGLTAHLTPHGRGADLYVDSLSTSELVVKCADPKAADVVFDFLVYGLRIGFEESSVVQEKTREAWIPAFTEHRSRYEKHPDWRPYDSLERFKAMSINAGLRSSFDFSAARALHDAIHEYDPAVDGPVDDGLPKHPSPGGLPSQASAPSTRPGSAGMRGSAGVLPPQELAASPSAVRPTEALPARGMPNTELFTAEGAVETGDVVAADPNRPGIVHQSIQAEDALVVGIVVISPESPSEHPLNMEAGSGASIPVAMAGTASCKVDASYGSIRPGDLLTGSGTPGHAMKALDPKPGTIIGKALEPLDSGTGLIQVLVMSR